MLAFARANGRRPVGLRLGFWRRVQLGDDLQNREVQLLPASMLN